MVLLRRVGTGTVECAYSNSKYTLQRDFFFVSCRKESRCVWNEVVRIWRTEIQFKINARSHDEDDESLHLIPSELLCVIVCCTQLTTTHIHLFVHIPFPIIFCKIGSDNLILYIRYGDALFVFSCSHFLQGRVLWVLYFIIHFYAGKIIMNLHIFILYNFFLNAVRKRKPRTFKKLTYNRREYM